jgi:pimeloyl-ACP methyl ester carboxylesterase
MTMTMTMTMTTTTRRFVRSGRAELCVDDSATPGEAIVCLHAGVCDRRMWAPQIEALQSTHRVIAYDRRGFGETRFENEPFAHVADLIAVLDALQVERAVLLGCSQGGRIAIDAALAHPSRVAALVLVAAAVSGAPEEAQPDDALSPRLRARFEACDAAEARGDRDAVNELEAQVWLDGPEQPTGRVGGGLRELFLAMNGIALAAPSPGEAVEAPSAWGRIEQIAVPTLIGWGPFDFASLIERMRVLARRIPGAESFEIEGTAHLPSLERPVVFNSRLLRFLGELQQRAR